MADVGWRISDNCKAIRAAIGSQSDLQFISHPPSDFRHPGQSGQSYCPLYGGFKHANPQRLHLHQRHVRTLVLTERENDVAII